MRHWAEHADVVARTATRNVRPHMAVIGPRLSVFVFIMIVTLGFAMLRWCVSSVKRIGPRDDQPKVLALNNSRPVWGHRRALAGRAEHLPNSRCDLVRVVTAERIRVHVEMPQISGFARLPAVVWQPAQKRSKTGRARS